MEWRGETEELEKKGVAKRRRNFAANQSAVRGVSQRENGRGAWAGAIQPGGAPQVLHGGEERCWRRCPPEGKWIPPVGRLDAKFSDHTAVHASSFLWDCLEVVPEPSIRDRPGNTSERPRMG